MTALSQQVRNIFDDAGLFDVKVFASSGFDEFKIAGSFAEGAKIDAFGVGTKVGVSSDAPFLDIVYKMVRFKDRPVKKLSPGKITLAGEKQVFRTLNQSGIYLEDVIGVRDEAISDAVPLLEKVMENGKLLGPHPSLANLQNQFKRNFSLIDDKYKSIHDKVDYPVRLSKILKDLQKSI